MCQITSFWKHCMVDAIPHLWVCRSSLISLVKGYYRFGCYSKFKTSVTVQLQHPSTINAQGTSGLWHQEDRYWNRNIQENILVHSTICVTHCHSLLAQMGSSRNNSIKLNKRVHCHGSSCWTWFGKSWEGGSKWSEILQRVLFSWVKDKVLRFKICEGLSGLYRFQPLHGVDV